MGSLFKRALSIGLVTLISGCLTARSREWVENKVKEGITQYKQEDDQRTKDKLREYEQWAKKNFEERVPLEQLTEAFYSTFQIVNSPYYETREGNILKAPGGTGSGMLLKGGYLLTAKHVMAERFSPSLSHYYWGLMKYHHHELSLVEKMSSMTIKRGDLKEILTGENLDYALLKLKGGQHLIFYKFGLNLPNKVKPGMSSIAMGYALGLDRNVRIGNLSQIESNIGENYFTFKNSIIFGDSGGPLFVIEEGNLKLVAISTRLSVTRGNHPTNIGYGLKVKVILEDMKEQLESGYLDEGTTKEVENFLNLNK